MAIGRLNIGLTGVQPGGLAKVIPSSVAVGSGSGSVDSNGTVTFSGASSVSLNSCFSSTYDNYRILINVTGSADDNTNFRLRVGGVDNSTASSYTRQFLRADSTTVSGGVLAQSFGFLGDTFTTGGTFAIDIFSPFLTTRTKLLSHNFRAAGAILFIGVDHNQTVSYDGFTIIANSGTITGTARVYGYN